MAHDDAGMAQEPKPEALDRQILPAFRQCHTLERALQSVSQKHYLELRGIGQEFTAGQPMQREAILGLTDSLLHTATAVIEINDLFGAHGGG